MNLKKAFQLQSYFNKILNIIDAVGFSSEIYIVSKVTKKKSQINEYLPAGTTSFSDIVEEEKDNKFGLYEINKVLDIYKIIIELNYQLSKAISKAKYDFKIKYNNLELDYDTAILLTKRYQRMATALNRIPLKDSSYQYTTDADIAYSPTVAPVSVVYDCIRTSSVEENTKVVVGNELEAVRTAAADISDLIEAYAVTTNVNPGAYDKFQTSWEFEYIYDNLDKIKNIIHGK